MPVCNACALRNEEYGEQMSFQYHERNAIARSLTRQGVFLDRANYNGVHKYERRAYVCRGAPYVIF